jgi:small subunit ribosomal protein S4
MKFKHKNYSRPKRPFDKERILEEAKIKKEFGLKNKREIWKVEAKLKSMRSKAKKLISADEKEKDLFFKQLGKIGIAVSTIGDVLSLEKKDLLNRRLQTIVFKKGLANTIKQARQMITHKKVIVDRRVVNIPSYVVPVDLENKIKIKNSGVTPKKEGKIKREKIVEEQIEENGDLEIAKKE